MGLPKDMFNETVDSCDEYEGNIIRGKRQGEMEAVPSLFPLSRDVED